MCRNGYFCKGRRECVESFIICSDFYCVFRESKVQRCRNAIKSNLKRNSSIPFFVFYLIGVDCFIAKCESAVHLNGANHIIHVIDGRWTCFRYGFRENYYRRSWQRAQEFWQKIDDVIVAELCRDQAKGIITADETQSQESRSSLEEWRPIRELSITKEPRVQWL